jgi:hypothetical protein
MKYLYIILICLLVFSCEETIDADPDSSNSNTTTSEY